MLIISWDHLKPGDHFLTVQLLGSGYAAVEMWINNEEADLGPFPEPYNTGFGRYDNKEDAYREMRDWAESDGIPVLDSYVQIIDKESP